MLSWIDAPDDRNLTIMSVSNTGNGAVAINRNRLHYTAVEGFSGTDNITYVISDGVNNFTKTITVHVKEFFSEEEMLDIFNTIYND